MYFRRDYRKQTGLQTQALVFEAASLQYAMGLPHIRSTHHVRPQSQIFHTGWIVGIEHTKITANELQLVSELASSLSPNSKLSLKKHFINPNLDAGLLARTYPDNPRHPQQRNYLTEPGLAVLEVLNAANSPQL